MSYRKHVSWIGALVLLVALALSLGMAGATNFNVACGNTAGLISAINTANGNGVADTITLNPTSLTNCSYTLSAVDNTTSSGNGLPVVSSAITINGNGATIERSSAGGTPDFRIFWVASGGNLVLNEVTIRNGRGADGAGLYNAGGTVTLTQSTVRDNQTSGFASGGGLWNTGGGSMLLSNSTVISNSAANNGGGVNNTSNSTLTLNSTTVINNSASGKGGGIWNDVSSVLMLNYSSVSSNSSDNEGGGIANYTGATVELSNSSVSGNTAQNHGAGIYNISGMLDVYSSTISRNHGVVGSGGGIWNSFGGIVNMTNSTVSGNSNFWNGGGINNTHTSTLTLTNTTISDNSSRGAGGLWNDVGSIVNFRNTIIAGNMLSSPGAGPDCVNEATFSSMGHNLVGNTSDCPFTVQSGDQVNINPKLGALQLNAPGRTETHSLLSGSPAINAGHNGTCPATDQRGVARNDCDIGAYENGPGFRIYAYIDGRSHLILRGQYVHWHHLVHAAPGRLLGANEPTIIDDVFWLPTWPDVPDANNWDCNCLSSYFYNVLGLPAMTQTVSLYFEQARDSVAIIQQPAANNGYTLIVDFNDRDNGADWYLIELTYESIVSAPLNQSIFLPTVVKE